MFGVAISLGTLALEELQLRRTPRARDLLLLAVAALLENFGYRQANLVFRLRGMCAIVARTTVGPPQSAQASRKPDPCRSSTLLAAWFGHLRPQADWQLPGSMRAIAAVLRRPASTAANAPELVIRQISAVPRNWPFSRPAAVPFPYSTGCFGGAQQRTGFGERSVSRIGKINPAFGCPAGPSFSGALNGLVMHYLALMLAER